MMRYTANAPDKEIATTPTMEKAMPETQINENIPQTVSPLGDDILQGADAIARFVFGDSKHRRKVYYLTGDAKKGIPYFKIGSLICARKSTLLRWIEQQEGNS
jgi:hypothetical protein